MSQQNTVNVVNVSTSHSSSQAEMGLKFFTTDGKFNFQTRGRKFAKLVDPIVATTFVLMAIKGVKGYHIVESRGSGCSIYTGSEQQIGFINGDYDTDFDLSRVDELLESIRESGSLVKETTLDDVLEDIAGEDLDSLLED